MRAFLEGRPDAVSALADRMRCIPRMLAARNRRSGRPLSEHDLADLAQDTASAILKKLASFEGRASLETWFHRFCGFEFANAVRRSSRQPTTMSEIDDANDRPIRYWTLTYASAGAPQPLAYFQSVIDVENADPIGAKGGLFDFQLRPHEGRTWHDVIGVDDLVVEATWPD